jgi:acetyl-CoA carboxylase biotin carboxyl carrier protein
VTIEEIRELIQMVSGTNVAELEVQRGDNRVRIRLGTVVHDSAASDSARPASLAFIPPPAARAAAAASAGPAAEPVLSENTEPEGDSSLVLVKSPIVGTFYESPSPGSPPFVRIGETVQPGKVLCIIESMKLMNEIEAESTGVIESRLVQNGSPVEYGEALFAVRPL